MLNTKQGVVVTLVAFCSVILLLSGLIPTLFQCVSNYFGPVCPTGGQNIPLSVLVLAYAAAELVMLIIGGVEIMWLAKDKQANQKSPVVRVYTDIILPVLLFLTFVTIIFVVGRLVDFIAFGGNSF